MVLHVDLNSFFARAEQQSQPHLRGRPIGILGKGHKGARTCVCAASPEAKLFGVKSGMSVWEARRLYPQILLVPPNYPKYLAISRGFIEILQRSSPWVEIFSVDEAFIDTKGGMAEAVATAQTIKATLYSELGELLTANIGIAWGKVFAKLAGELNKPDGLTVLEPATWLEKVGRLPIAELCGVGRQLEKRLAQLNVRTIRDLSQSDASMLVASFGPSTGMRLWQIGQGIDRAKVTPSHDLPPAKSIGHQITLDQDWSLAEISPIITKLTAKVGRRLRRSKQQAQEISLYLGLSNSSSVGNRQRCRPAISADSDLLRTAHHLYTGINLPRLTRIRRISVTSSGLSPRVEQTLPLFLERIREERLTNALDTLRDRHGETIIEWADGFGSSLGDLRDWRGPRAVLDQ